METKKEKLMVLAINPDCEWQVFRGSKFLGTIYKNLASDRAGYDWLAKGRKKVVAYKSRNAIWLMLGAF